MTEKLIALLENCITERRKELFNSILSKRTRYITLALEDIYQSQNASAVLRTADCFGIQDVHIIENRNEYMLNPDVTLGSDKWLNLYKYSESRNPSLQAIQTLREQGYRIIATTPHTNDTCLNDLDLSKGKIALFFGTELNGLTPEIIDNADEFLKIPMHGFTESFNISVSAAIILHTLTEKLRKSELNWNLPNEEKMPIKLEWLRNTVKSSEMIEKDFLSEQVHNQNIK